MIREKKMLKYMDNVELEIASVKNLRMVHFYSIAGENGMIPGVMAYYKKDQVINLCKLDEYYEDLLYKLVVTYNKESQKRDIIIDDYSKSIIENISFQDEKFYDELVADYEEMPLPVCAHNGYIKYVIVPLLKYIIGELYSLEEKTLEWSPLYKDWYGRGELNAILGNEKKSFAYAIKSRGEGDYDITLSNVLKSIAVTNIHIVYGKHGINITIDSPENKINGRIDYILDIAGKIMIQEAEIYIYNKLVCNQRQEIAFVPMSFGESEMHKLIHKIMPDASIAELPWGQKIVLQSVIQSNQDMNTEDISLAYMMDTSEIVEAIILSYMSVKENDKVSYDVTKFKIDAYESYKHNLFQVHFLNDGYESNGYYKEKLADKYYGRVL